MIDYIILAGMVLALVVINLITKEKEDKEKHYYESLQEFDKALANNDTDTMSVMFDELREEGSYHTGRQNDKETSER